MKILLFLWLATFSGLISECIFPLVDDRAAFQPAHQLKGNFLFDHKKFKWIWLLAEGVERHLLAGRQDPSRGAHREESKKFGQGKRHRPTEKSSLRFFFFGSGFCLDLFFFQISYFVIRFYAYIPPSAAKILQLNDWRRNRMEIMQRTAICRVNPLITVSVPCKNFKIIILNLLKNEFSTLTLGLCSTWDYLMLLPDVGL